MKTRVFGVVVLASVLASCAGAQVTRTSANSMLVDAGAAPACGPAGAAKVAAKAAAIETIKAGYDRYIITSGSAQNNVAVTQLPGSYQTSGVATYNRGFGTYNATTTYVPGPTLVSGSHDRSLGVIMFKPGEPGFEQALDAREQLGPEWREIVKSGVRTCL
jgi:hypothetical protein